MEPGESAETHPTDFATAAARCALRMLGAALQIREQVPTLVLPEGMAAQLNAACDSLVGTKHDLLNELAELKERPGNTRPPPRLGTWLSEPLMELHAIIVRLQSAVIADHRYAPAAAFVGELAAELASLMQAAKHAADSVLVR